MQIGAWSLFAICLSPFIVIAKCNVEKGSDTIFDTIRGGLNWSSPRTFHHWRGEDTIDNHFPGVDLGNVRPRRDPPVVGNRHAAGGGGEAGDGVRGERGGVEGGGGHQRSLRAELVRKNWKMRSLSRNVLLCRCCFRLSARFAISPKIFSRYGLVLKLIPLYESQRQKRGRKFLI